MNDTERGHAFFMTQHPEKFAVFVADDFGRSSSVNLAIAEAHDRGILSAASIMAGEKAFDEAVRISKIRHRLSVGLHVTLCDGKSVLPHTEIPGIVDTQGCFETNPARAWIKYWTPGLRKQLDLEIGAQFDRLEKAGIKPDHVDSHHHLHMHPLLFTLISRHASRRGVRWVRIPCEPLKQVFHARNAARGASPFLEWAVFRALRFFYKRAKARTHGLRALPYVYGLSRTGQVDEQYLFDLFPQSEKHMEIFFHPDIATESGRRELDALLSGVVRKRLETLGIHIAGYGELSAKPQRIDTGLINAHS
jgi:chitin disaccharide deacetylase